MTIPFSVLLKLNPCQGEPHLFAKYKHYKRMDCSSKQYKQTCARYTEPKGYKGEFKNFHLGEGGNKEKPSFDFNLNKLFIISEKIQLIYHFNFLKLI